MEDDIDMTKSARESSLSHELFKLDFLIPSTRMLGEVSLVIVGFVPLGSLNGVSLSVQQIRDTCQLKYS